MTDSSTINSPQQLEAYLASSLDPSTREVVSLELDHTPIPAQETVADITIALNYQAGLDPSKYLPLGKVADFVENYLQTVPHKFYENLNDDLGQALLTDSQLGLSSVLDSVSIKLAPAPTTGLPYPFSTTVSVKPDGKPSEAVSLEFDRTPIPSRNGVADIAINLDYLSGLDPSQYLPAQKIANFVENYLQTVPHEFYENINDDLGKALLSDSQLGLSSVLGSLSVKLDPASKPGLPYPFSTTFTGTPDGKSHEDVSLKLDHTLIPSRDAVADFTIGLDYRAGLDPSQYLPGQKVADFVKNYLQTAPHEFYEGLNDDLGKALLTDSQLGLSSVLDSLSIKLDPATKPGLPYPFSTTFTGTPDGKSSEDVSLGLDDTPIPARGAVADVTIGLDYLSGLDPSQYLPGQKIADFVENYLQTVPKNGEFYENISDELGKALFTDSQLGLSSVLGSLSIKLTPALSTDLPFPESTTVSVIPDQNSHTFDLVHPSLAI